MRKKLNFKNITPELLKAVEAVEGWFDCWHLRELPKNASLEQIKEALLEDASFTISMLDDIESAAKRLSYLAGPYA
jgi:hypothetical protein